METEWVGQLEPGCLGVGQYETSRGPHILVHVSIYQGNPKNGVTLFSTPQPDAYCKEGIRSSLRQERLRRLPGGALPCPRLAVQPLQRCQELRGGDRFDPLDHSTG